MRIFLPFLLLLSFFESIAIDKNLLADWSKSGSNFTISASAKKISLIDFGAKADNVTDNAPALNSAIASLKNQGGIIEIPAGSYLFKKTIHLPSNIIIRGSGSDKTKLNFDLGGTGDLFTIQGSSSTISSPVSSGTSRNSKVIEVANGALFAPGDHCVIKQSANHLLASNWAYNYFFQVVKIVSIKNNSITFDKPLRLDFSPSANPVLTKISPVQNSGIESVSIKRSDASTAQASNIFLNYAVNCHVKGVEMENANYAHITLQSAAFCTVSGNYLHDAFDYGSGGKGYGIVLQFGSGDNFIYDNILEHLRHSILLQAEANGNVIGYNYSYDPFWKQGWLPDNSAGDIVLHGNYPYANLIEGNILQNLVIDNSHGMNGPYNTFFRNRIESYGIVMNGGSGSRMNFIANEITGSGFFKGLYSLDGTHSEIANNVKGKLQPGSVTETSLISSAYTSKIGAPNPLKSWTNAAYVRSASKVKTIVSDQPVKIQDVTKKPVKKVKKKKRKR